MNLEDFHSQIRDWASTAAIIPEWGKAGFWTEHMVPFLSNADTYGDKAVKTILDKGHPRVMRSMESAFDWLLSFLEDGEFKERVKDDC